MPLKTDTLNKVLCIYEKDGLFHVEDETSPMLGDSQLLDKGNHTFSLMDCASCKIIFQIENNAIKKVTRVFRESVVFYPEKK